MHVATLHERVQGLKRPEALLIARTRIVEALNPKAYLNDLCAPALSDIAHIQQQLTVTRLQAHSEPLETIYRDLLAQLTASGLDFSLLQQYAIERPRVKPRKEVRS